MPHLERPAGDRRGPADDGAVRVALVTAPALPALDPDSQLLPRLAAARTRLRLAGLFYYTWLSPELGDDESFSYAGLRRLAGGGIVAKPALAAFRTSVRRSR